MGTQRSGYSFDHASSTALATIPPEALKRVGLPPLGAKNSAWNDHLNSRPAEALDSSAISQRPRATFLTAQVIAYTALRALGRRDARSPIDARKGDFAVGQASHPLGSAERH